MQCVSGWPPPHAGRAIAFGRSPEFARSSRKFRVNGRLRESEPVERPPHPDPLPASAEREPRRWRGKYDSPAPGGVGHREYNDYSVVVYARIRDGSNVVRRGDNHTRHNDDIPSMGGSRTRHTGDITSMG